MGAVAGGLGGHFLGKKADHGILGTLAGAFLGSKMEDKYKDKNKHSSHGGGSHHGGSHHGGSQYGGSYGKW